MCPSLAFGTHGGSPFEHDFGNLSLQQYPTKMIRKRQKKRTITISATAMGVAAEISIFEDDEDDDAVVVEVELSSQGSMPAM